tara:strand:- start:3145 stop:3447 length:303 start_codon:yes stop_codon:yes gene_type:complete
MVFNGLEQTQEIPFHSYITVQWIIVLQPICDAASKWERICRRGEESIRQCQILPLLLHTRNKVFVFSFDGSQLSANDRYSFFIALGAFHSIDQSFRPDGV